jgi:hypothetical protein
LLRNDPESEECRFSAAGHEEPLISWLKASECLGFGSVQNSLPNVLSGGCPPRRMFRCVLSHERMSDQMLSEILTPVCGTKPTDMASLVKAGMTVVRR